MGTRQDARSRENTGDGRRVVTPAMRWVIAAVAAVVVGGLIWAMVLGGSADDGESSPADGSAASDGAVGAAPSGAAATPYVEPTPVDGSEVLPPAASVPSSGRLPALPAQTPRITTPLPADADAAGALVEGYPNELAGPTPLADVVHSSLAGDGSTLQVTLTARTDETLDTVIAAYRERWAGLGLAPLTVADDPSGAGALAYRDGYTSISLAVTAAGTGTVYTVSATLRTE